ncbi:SDR family oxidoreductase [Prochlorococcus sp. MIT 1223]|uniref:SDR family oxidoreductase n=1 Tax=Prochlorococcus sp. MIT 1223 TaxID=3096217 RepID=UPI002A759C82|nr:SDR family oxidoreductase [Prochlorococcus sp. MIT 1223]
MNTNNFNLKGKTALITGSSGLLGVQHASALLDCGANVVLTDVDLVNLNKAKDLLLKQFPSSSLYSYIMDVTCEESIQNVNINLLSDNLPINILINNAAINPKIDKESNLKSSSRLEDFSIDEWNREIAVGLTGAFLCSKKFGTEMAKRKNGGCILNIASDLSVISPDQRIYMQEGVKDDYQPVKPITYSVIKSGLIGMTKYLATYWLGSNIRCNSLSPGGIYTSQPDDFVVKLSTLIPLGRMAKKEEYKSAIQFLCSEASSYMNGHNLIMDGGRSIW